jgi:hypothetical protein
MSKGESPVIRYVVDPQLGLSFYEIIFPGWIETKKYGKCAYRFHTHQELDLETAIEMAKTLKCQIEIEDPIKETLEILDFSNDEYSYTLKHLVCGSCDLKCHCTGEHIDDCIISRIEELNSLKDSE